MSNIERVLIESGLPMAAVWAVIKVIEKLSPERKRSLGLAILASNGSEQ